MRAQPADHLSSPTADSGAARDKRHVSGGHSTLAATACFTSRTARPGTGEREKSLIAALLLTLLLILLFGGLGVFVAKVFLLGLIVAALVGIVAGFGGWSRGGI